MSRRHSSTSALAGGAALTLVLHVVMGIFYIFILIPLFSAIEVLRPLAEDYNWLLPFFFPGVAQVVYIVPLCWWLYRLGKRELMKGVIMGAVLTIFLNGSCYLWIAMNASR